MKQGKTVLILAFVLALTGCANRTTDSLFDNKLNQSLEKKDYFTLSKLLENNEDKLSQDRLLYYKAIISQSFGKRKQSNEYINVLLGKYKNRFNDSLLVELLELKAANYIYIYNYKQASDIYSNILTDYPSVIDSSGVESIKNVINLFGTFASVKPQMMHPHKTVEIASYRNKFNHLMVPVRSNNVSDDFIFDTGANLSTISASQAKKMDLNVFEQQVKVGSSTKLSVQTKLAFADSLYVGDILFKNVLFYIMPDEMLASPEMNFQIKGIIGFPIIHQLEEVHLHKDGSLTIPEKTMDRKIRNMFFEGLNPVVKILTEKDTLLFTVDTGARASELSFKYFNAHKSDVEKRGELQTNPRTGAGGKTMVKEYMLSNFPMTIGSKSTVLTKIPVTLEEYSFNKFADGNLGQDLFTQFNSLIINFKYMYIDFE